MSALRVFAVWTLSTFAVLAVVSVGACDNELDVEGDGAPPVDTLDNIDVAGVYDCSERSDTGYRAGDAFAITVVTVDGRPVERSTANAYVALQAAAADDGVRLRIVSGFRTMSQQEYLYGCYVNCNCNNCNLAARPGYSNHQSGHALDLNTSDPGVLSWLNANGPSFGWERTVPSEAWHWEWWGDSGDYPGPCGADPRCIDDPGFGGCDGTVVTRCAGDVVTTDDCAEAGASCSTAGGAPHCVHPSCLQNLGAESGSFCRDGTNILQTCTDGQLTEGDCGFFGATCSESGGEGHCVHPSCPANLDGAEDGTFCIDGTDRLATCERGRYVEDDCAAVGALCSQAGGAGHCVHPLCWTNLDGGEDGSFCLDDGTLIVCAQGVPTTTVCAAVGDASDVCAGGAGGARCAARSAPTDATAPGDGATRPLPPSVGAGGGCRQTPAGATAALALALLLRPGRRRGRLGPRASTTRRSPTTAAAVLEDPRT
jgi:hypothetical protein